MTPSPLPTQPTAPSFETPGRGVVLICDQAAIRSTLITGDAPGVGEGQIYIALFADILARSELNIVFHTSRPNEDRSATAAAIARWRRELPAVFQARFRVADAVPLDAVLGEADLFVSFASPALVEGCGRGLKPVQIGRALTGSAGFTHIFADSAALVDWIAWDGSAAQLSLDEYAEFERFAGALLAGAATGARADDPVVRELRRAGNPRLSPLGVIGDILANPVGALRLLVGTLAGFVARHRPTRNAGR